MAYRLKDKYGYIYTIDDALVKVVDDQLFILFGKVVLGSDIYMNYYISADFYKQGGFGNVYSGQKLYGELLGSGNKLSTSNMEYYYILYQDGRTLTYNLRQSATNIGDCRYTIYNDKIYEPAIWIPDAVVNVEINALFIFNNNCPVVHIGKNVKTLWILGASKVVNDDAVNTSLEKLTVRGSTVIKLRNCVNLDYIDMPNDNVDSIDFYVDKRYKSLSKKKWTHDNCLVTDYRWMVNNRPLEKIDWKGLFNRSISNEADNYMCVQTDDAVVQIPLYMVQDGQSIDVDNVLLIKEDEGVYYCPVTKEKTDKSIMAIQSTDCVYYVDSE